MKIYEKVTFEPCFQTEEFDRDCWAKQNQDRLVWIEKVACTVLNYIQCDEFLRPARIVEILDKAGRRDLISPNPDNLPIGDKLEYSRLAGPFTRRLIAAMSNSDRLFHVQLCVFRHEEDVGCNGGQATFKRVWYHFFPDPDYFNYATGELHRP